MKMFKVVSFSLALLVGLQPVALFGVESNQKSLKSRAVAQFDESVKRFKKCLSGECTKPELLKVARDVTIAVYLAAQVVAGVAAVGYLGSRAIDSFNYETPALSKGDIVRIRGWDGYHMVKSYDPATKRARLEDMSLNTYSLDELELLGKAL
jgi:hypothetical protein